MLTQANRFAQEFVKMVNEEIDRLKEEVSDGNMSPEQYKTSTGKILGLRTALYYVEEAAAVVDGRERKPKNVGDFE